MCVLGADTHLSKPWFPICKVGVIIVSAPEVVVGIKKGQIIIENFSLTYAKCSGVLGRFMSPTSTLE